MANLFFTGFENLNDPANLEGYSRVGDAGQWSFSSPGRFGSGRIFNVGQWSGALFDFTNTSNDTIIFGAAYKITSGNNYGDRMIAFGTSAGTHVYFSLNTTTKKFSAYNSAGTLLGTASNDVLVDLGTWYFIEVKVKVDDSAGEIVMRIDGTTVLSLTGIDTRNNSIGQYVTRIYPAQQQLIVALDDMYINNTIGSAPHNDFYGEIRIDGLSPTSDNSVQFTRSAGANNYVNVDDGTSPDDDSTYNYSSTVGHKDLLGLSGYTTSSGATILGVGITTRAKRADPGTRTFRNVVKSSSTEVTGSTFTLTSAYINVRQNVYTDPATSAAFADAAAINNLKVGYEIVA